MDSQVYQWEREMRNEWELVKNENIWIVLGGVSELTLGVVYMYMAAGRDPVSVEWNRLLIEKLDREIGLLKDQGKDIMLVGDFNGHIGEPANGDRHSVAPDRQGREVKAAWARWGLEMVNRSKKATGKWTRMRGDGEKE